MSEDVQKIPIKTKTAKMLPKTVGEITNGGVYLQRVRCGKQNCKCARGEAHSAYYFFARREGKIIKMYVRKSELEEFSRLVKVATIERKHRRHNTKSNLTLLKELRQALRDRDSIIQSLKGNKQYV